ncbi:flavohemoglobin expression-modulating QEGLA motif protein [Sphingomonas flavescens]|uniref:flavohemoglobin expression-modulating QEGLA motif protein n=1 Tax=Sphingomonas flavescens TaxID=3132797 RepID=UPI002805C8A8|nr:tyrosine/phenylalanine carboxypeptidase domain-containing protein [Sphingomonas limnosediminicola]
MTQPRLQVVGEGLDFGKRGDLRQNVGKTGRIHLDRWQPFLVLHRAVDPARSIARRVAVNSPAYLIWSPEDDQAAGVALSTLADALRDRFGSLLLLSVEDAPWNPVPEGSQNLHPFDFRVSAAGSPASGKALECLVEALGKIRIDLRKPDVSIGDADGALAGIATDAATYDRVSLVVPQIHRLDERTFYPQVTRDLAVAVGDALLKTACVYMSRQDVGAPSHFRSLGRSAFLSAALDADRKLDKVARSFDFLLSVSPINSREAMERFFADGEAEPPKFRYRPLTIDPAVGKRGLYAVDLSIVEDPLLERLLSEKRQEIDHQLTMLATRNTSAFKAASLLQYGTVSNSLLADAQAILARPKQAKASGEVVGAIDVAAAAHKLVEHYRAIDDRFDAAIEVRDDVGSLLVSGGKLMIAGNTAMLQSRVDALLAHEISVHLLTYFNGASQGLTAFRTGLANYEGVQEGLGVFAEWAVGGLSEPRMRLLAGRVVAVAAMVDGAEFLEVYRDLVDRYRLRRKAAFDITTRVFRSGGFAKDLIYLKGFQDVMGLVARGAALDPFWIGKIAVDHVDEIEELMQRNLVRPPLFQPEFLGRADVQRRIAAVRGQSSLSALLDVE